MFTEIKKSLRQLYLEDERPWLVGPGRRFSFGLPRADNANY